MSNRDPDKRKKQKVKDGYSAYEIYEITKKIFWPVALVDGVEKIDFPENSKGSALQKALNELEKGLYFFTPGQNQNVEVFKLEAKTISKAQLCIGNLKNVQKDFNKKFGDSEEWFIKVKSRLKHLKYIVSLYEKYLAKKPGCINLETVVHFAATSSKRPSNWVSINELKEISQKENSFFVRFLIDKHSKSSSSLREWYKVLYSKHEIPIDIFFKLVNSKTVSGQVIESILNINPKLTCLILMEWKINGLPFSQTINSLPILFSEFEKFHEEIWLRACLSRDLIIKALRDENSWKTIKNKKFLDYANINRVIGEELDSHLKAQGIASSSDSYNSYDAIHWFTGISKKKPPQIHLPKYYPFEPLEDLYEKIILRKVKLIIPPPDKIYFFKITSQYLHLCLNNGDAVNSSVVQLISTCREFCPPTESGNASLELCEFILEKIKDENSEYIQWLSENLSALLVHSHNKAMENRFHSPEFKKTSKVLGRILNFMPTIFESEWDIKYLLRKDYISTLLCICPEKPSRVLKWMANQEKSWFDDIQGNRYYWSYILNLPDSLIDDVLNWATELRTKKYYWSDIGIILFQIHSYFRPSLSDLIHKQFKFFIEIHKFSSRMDRALKKLHNKTYSNTFIDVCSFIGYWEKSCLEPKRFQIIFENFFTLIEGFVKEHGGSSNFFICQTTEKIDWLNSLNLSEDELFTLLEVVPFNNYEDYDQTQTPLNWLIKNCPEIKITFKRLLNNKAICPKVFKMLKVIEVARRLNPVSLSRTIKNWQVVVDSHDSLEKLKNLRRFASFGALLPNNIQKILDLNMRFEREFKSLSVRKNNGQLSEQAVARYEKLKEWLVSPHIIEERISFELEKALPEAIALATLDSLTQISQDICQKHWLKIFKFPLGNWNDDWRNALQLSFETNYNKRIIKKLITNAAGNDFQWIYYHPKNTEFLNRLPESFNSESWLNPFSYSFTLDKRKYTVEVERNLIKVLQMGNYFGSCLSVGDINDFSTISNAVEINKHVLWLKTDNGKIIGRKLIVLNNFGEIYGFNSYGASLYSNNEKPWYKIIFDCYCLLLADSCNAKLSNKRRKKEKIVLFTKWYDDGIEDFDSWTLKQQNGKSLHEVASKLKFNPDNSSSFRTSLILSAKGFEINSEWKESENFKKNQINKFEYFQK